VIGALGRPRLLVALAAALVAAAILVTGLAAAGAPHTDAFFTLGVQRTTADADRTVHLRISAENAGDQPVAGTLSITPTGNPAGTPPLWAAGIRADRAGSGTVDVTIPAACGRRLTATFASPGHDRSLLVLVPCPDVGPQP
jgi:hypothetical protein